MQSVQNLFLADDDPDDCLFFKEALDELPVSTKLTTITDGAALMHLLAQKEDELPHVLFLDLNMPRKNGFECLAEIKQDEKLKSLPVIIFSTSFDKNIAGQLYENGAHYYIRKPGEFSKLKEVIQQSLLLISETGMMQPAIEEFVLNAL